MDIKTALLLVKPRFLASTLVVLLVVGGGLAHIGTSLLEQKDKLTADQRQLETDRAIYEKYRADISIALKEQLYEIQKREFVVQQLENQSKEKLAALQQRSAKYEVEFNQLKQAQYTVSAEQRTKLAEEQLKKLMHEFSDLGVSLNASNHCKDTESIKKLATARSKFYEALALAEANGLTKRYDMFFFHNGQSVQHVCFE